MKKWQKAVLWTVGTLVTLIIVFILTINTIVCHVLRNKVDYAITRTDTLLIGYKDIKVDVFTGRMWVFDVVFQTDKLPEDSFRAFSRMTIDIVKLEGVNYRSLLYDREIDLSGILIQGVTYRGILDTKAMKAHETADAISEEQKRQFRALLKEAQKYLNRVTLRRLAVKDVKVDLKALETGLEVHVRKMGVELQDLGYSLKDKIPFHLDNSKWHLFVNDINVRMPDSLMYLTSSAVFTTPAVRGLVVADVRFATDSIFHDDQMYHAVSIDTIRLEHIGIPDPGRSKSFKVERLRIVNCDYFGCIDETKKKEGKKKKSLDQIDFSNLGFETKEAQFIAKIQQQQEKILSKQKQQLLEMAQLWFDEIVLENLYVENVHGLIKSYKTNLEVDVSDINLGFHDIGYSLLDTIPYHFNDQVYAISIGHTDVTMPDGLMKLECNGLSHKNCGPLTIGRTRVYNTVDKWKLAHIRGDITSTWTDVTLDTFYTSAFSPFQTFYKGKLKMESVTAIVGDMYLFTDNRNLTIKEIRLPSKKALLEVKDLLKVGAIRVGVRNVKADITGAYANPGIVTVRDAMVVLKDSIFQEIKAEDIHFKFPDSDIRMDIEEIETSWFYEGLVVRNVAFRTSEDYIPGEQFHSFDIDSIIIEGVMLPDFKDKSDIAASCLRIVHPIYKAYVDERPKRLRVKGKEVEESEETTDYGTDYIEKKKKAFKKAQLDNVMNVLQEWLDNAQISDIKIDDADVNIHSIHSGFSLSTRDLHAYLSGVKFNIEHFKPININDSTAIYDPIKNNFKLLGKNAITYLSLRKLHTTLPDSSMFLNVRAINTDRSTRSLIITGVEFATDTVIPVDELYHDVSIDSIRLDGIILPDMKEQKEASLSNLRIINACYYGQINEKRKKAKKKETINGAEVEEEESEEIKRKSIKQDRAMRIVSRWFDGASMDVISIENASAKVKSMVSNLDMDVRGFNLQLNDISYELDNMKGFQYNDSIYSFGFDHADILLPDSSMIIEVNNLNHANCGPLSIGRTRMVNTIDKWEIAHTKGDIPSTWMRMVIDTVHTSDIDPFRIMETAGKIRLDSITAVVDTMYIFRDIRYKPVKPYKMPHAPIMSAPAKVADMFSLNVADATINDMEIVLPKTDSCIMKMTMQDIHGMVYDINTKPGNTITIEGDAHWGGGVAHIDMALPLEPNYPWNIAMTARGIDLHCLDELTFPIAALKIGGTIDEMKTILSGDSVNALGYLSLAYSGLDIRFLKGSPTPIKFLRNNPKFLTCIARAFVSKRNPRKAGRLPLAYQAEWKNDRWKPSALFMIGPVIKGTVETMLPGLFVHKRVKQDKLIVKHTFKDNTK